MLKSQRTQFCHRLNLDSHYCKLLFLKVIYLFSFFTYAFSVFSELDISANLAVLFHHRAAPHLSLWQEKPGCPRPWNSLVWSSTVGGIWKTRQAERCWGERCVSVRVLSNAQVSHPQGQGREGINLPQEEAQNCSGAQSPFFFSHFFLSRTLPFIICRSFGAPWTEELLIGLNAPKHQNKPTVSVCELLYLLQGISWHFTVRHERLAGPLLVH